MVKLKSRVCKVKAAVTKAVADPDQVKDKKILFQLIDDVEPERKSLFAATARFGVTEKKHRRN